MSTESRSKIEAYIDSVKGQISLEELDGYLPADAIIGAFNKGEEHGEAKLLKKLKDIFINNTSQHFLYSLNIYNKLKEAEFCIEACYISPVSKNTIYVTSVEDTTNDEFIDLFYDLAFDFEDRFLKDNKSHLHFSFIGNENIDEEQLVCDNYINIL
ncbi:hypothetical protein [Chryseobacterium sp.]|uniref:hypothetical protein n=1 Tax=Chryseobacterium sp. TaxID=1871047 RepID=UPI0024E2304A|nr:hypothetical protein [Chryseobacterium sp.]